MNALQEKLDLRDLLRRELELACRERDQRTSIVETESGPETAWVLYERYRMLEAVNLFRAACGLPCVSGADIRRADQLATGHVDWIDKFPLYCAELVLRDGLKAQEATR
jgi:hypothetical protein